MVLAASHDLYPDIAISVDDVLVCELTADEKMVSFHNPIGKLLPADVSAANFRVPNRRILGGEILRGNMFKEESAEGLSLRLKQSMRAVDVFVPPKRCAGGVIQLGEHVNVNLTMTITDADGKKINRTAEIARDCRVIIVSGDISNRMTLDPEVSSHSPWKPTHIAPPSSISPSTMALLA